ncbi:hypothetical protein AMTR_s00076p00102070 [Amborella trichopoda]|uniref:Pentacotripeptide-repeat region of PRORP domain-containing protein n=1 Tax=Amborella trichopoda TaxID=13333 RepID=W1P9T1_AMBTC|nr:hypothetical protein AMTR_s00076p00102070 [Amborella trichopoda]
MKKPAIPNFEITSLFHCKPTPPIKFKSLQNQSNQASKPNNPTSWNSILFSLSLLNQPDEALALFACMHRSGCKPDNYTFHPVLKACTTLSSLHLGKMAHNLVAKLGHGSDEGVSKGLLNLYAKCGASSEASCLFQEMPHRDVVTWNICVSASVQTMRYAEALTLVHEMHESEEMPMPNSITLAVAFTACAKLNALLSSQGLHGYAIKMGFESWTLVANAILSMYSKCQKVLDACKLFDWLPDRDVVSWNAIIAGCAQNGLFEEAFGYFQCMVSGKDQAPNYATIATVLSICAELEGQCEEGEEVHCYVEKVGLVSNSSVANALLSYYSRVEDMEGAERVFREMKWRDIVSWNAVIAGYAQNGWLSKAVEFFRDLLCDGMNPESITIISLLPLCAQLGHVHVGRMIHGLIAMDMGLHDNVAVRNALISFYAKCGETVDAYLTFETMPNRDIISWNTMLATCAQIGEEDKIGSLLNRMIMEGTKPDSVTILSIISFYINPRHGKEVHGYCIRSDDAETIFREMRERDLTTWNLMIQLNAENTNPDRAIDLFHDLQNQGMRPDAISIMSILPACACLASMHIVKQCHAYITRSYFSDHFGRFRPANEGAHLHFGGRIEMEDRRETREKNREQDEIGEERKQANAKNFREKGVVDKRMRKRAEMEKNVEKQAGKERRVKPVRKDEKTAIVRSVERRKGEVKVGDKQKKREADSKIIAKEAIRRRTEIRERNKDYKNRGGCVPDLVVALSLETI